MSNSNISQKWTIKIVVFLLALILTVGVGFIFRSLNSGIEVKVTDIPKGESDKKVGQVITASQSKSIENNGVRITFPQLHTKQNGANQQEQKSKQTTIVAATFKDKVRLIDFFVTGINEKPELSFKSTARGLVFMNPLFSGLSFEKRVLIFQAIEQNSKFQDLVKAVVASSSLLDNELINLSTDIAIKIAKDNNLFIADKKTSYLPFDINFNKTNNNDISGNSKAINPLQMLSNWLIPAVQAQSNNPNKSRLEYTLTKQLPNDKLLFDQISFDYPIWHGMKLDASDGVVKITGTSPLVQQLIVVPKAKLKTINIGNDDYGGAKKLDADVVAEALLEPADLGIWDGSVVKTAQGGNQIEKVLTPRGGGDWQPGEYKVLISAGAKLSRTGEGQPFGAVYLNLASYLLDNLSFVIGTSGENTHKDNVVTVAQLVGDCGKSLSLEAKDFYSTIETLNECVTKPEKLIKIGKIFGLPVDEETIKSTVTLFRFKGEVWGKLAKRLVKVIDVTDKGIGLSRTILLGQYLNREQTQGIYAGEFSVIEKPYVTLSDKLDSAEIEVECVRGNQEYRKKYQALDVIIERTCYGNDGAALDDLKITNYSKNAVEVKLDVSNHLPNLLYPNEEQDYAAATFNIDPKKHGKVLYTLLNFSLPKRVKVFLKSYSPYNVANEFTTVCGEKAEIWGLYIESECVPPGLRAKYWNKTRHTISLGFTGESDPPIVLKGKRPENFSDGGSGTLESSSTKVNILLISNP